MTIKILQAASIHAVHLFENCRIHFSAVVTFDGADTVYVLLGIDRHAEQDLDRLIRIYLSLCCGQKPRNFYQPMSSYVLRESLR